MPYNNNILREYLLPCCIEIIWVVGSAYEMQTEVIKTGAYAEDVQRIRFSKIRTPNSTQMQALHFVCNFRSN